MTTNESLSLDFEQIQKVPLHEFTEKAYLDYSMYVILDRALPHISDGLKPVQRRIIYAMSELGLKSVAKYKKSARTVGDVIGKFHPHGDSACYEAMVLMAQSFSYRYPLVDGQGNWGSIDDPKSFAAMRYTESKLTAYADTLLSELGQGTVDWASNFDGTLKEPRLLPARLPNILLNGTTGIAVGMATDIPPHNLREISRACIHLLSSPKASIKELCKYVKGPDFPTHAEIITPKNEIRNIYASGNGTIKMRAIWEKEEGNIVINALPFQSSGSKILEQIATQIQSKKLPMLEDIRDESDHESPTRIVLVPKSNRVDVEELMSHLFATTDLEKNYRVNLNMIGLNGRPQVKDLSTILKEWISYRIETVTKRLQYRLDTIIAQIHILEGLMIAYLNIDKVIEIIRNKERPKPELMKRFKLSNEQAEAILELKLRKLAKLEENRIKGELSDLGKERKILEQTLSSKQRLKSLIKKELQADADQYGNERKSPLKQREESKALDEATLVPSESITIILSEKGWIRAAKGHDIDPETLNYRSGDQFKSAAPGKSNQPAIFIDSTGRCYSLPSYTLPSARSLGEPVSSQLNPPDGATFEGVMTGSEEDLYLLATDAGYGFVARLESLYTKNKSGKSVVSVSKNAKVITACKIFEYEKDILVAISSIGRLLAFPVVELPELSKGKGLKLIQIPPAKFKTREEYLVAICIIPEHAGMVIRAGQRKLTLKYKDIEQYFGERGRRGHLLPRGYRNVSSVKYSD